MNEHDDHEEECDEDCDCEDENAELEAEFKAHVEKVQEEIQKHVAAEAELDKAIELAHEHGVSFYSSISHIGQNYNVDVLEKFSKLGHEIIDEITDTYNEYGGEGWEHSAVC